MTTENNPSSEPVSVTKITSNDDFQKAQSALPSTALSVLYFHAPWAAPCQQMSAALDALASTYTTTSPPSISFISVDAEEQSDIAETYDVPAVPFIILQRDGKTLESVSGSDPARVRAALEKHYTSASAVHAGGAANGTGQTKKLDLPPAQTVTRPDVPPSSTIATGPKDGSTAEENETASTKEQLQARLSELVKAAPVMLFMKGTPSAPQCGFSRQTVGMLREKGVRYGFFNILADDDVRQGLKEYADWPTYPQIWVDGELVGGLDIVSFSFFLFFSIYVSKMV